MNLDDEAVSLGYANRDGVRQRRSRWWSHFVWIMPALMLACFVWAHKSLNASMEDFLGYLCISCFVNVVTASFCIALLVASRSSSRRAIFGMLLIGAWLVYPVSPVLYTLWKGIQYPPHLTPRELNPKAGQPLAPSGR